VPVLAIVLLAVAWRKQERFQRVGLRGDKVIHLSKMTNDLADPGRRGIRCLLSCSLSRMRACLTCRQQPGKNFFSVGAQSRRQGPKTPVQQALMRGLDTAFPGFVLGLPRSRGERRSVDRLLTGTRVPHLALPPALSTSKKI
jgi:hypothetical protein